MTGREGVAAIVAAAIVAFGLIVGGYLLGNGLLRAHRAERSVEMKGLAERDVAADLAVWRLAYSATGSELAPVQAKIDADTRAVVEFLKGFGFADAEISNAGVNVSQFTDNMQRPNITVRQAMQLRTTNIAAAERAFAAQSELVRRGVALEADRGNPISYNFTRLNDVKPAMIAEATRNARAAAEQFASDSGAEVGGIKSATQGYFSILPRDGEGQAATESPRQKVRVVSTINFYLED